MKLWYQSMSRQKARSGYNHALRRILDSVKDPDTEIEVHGVTKIGGVADRFHYLDYLESGEVLTNVQVAMRRGFDAFLIGNIGDPGLHAAREIADIPVLALCETSLHLACQMGRNFSLVIINEKFTPRTRSRTSSTRRATGSARLVERDGGALPPAPQALTGGAQRTPESPPSTLMQHPVT